MLNDMNIEHRLDLDKLILAGNNISGILQPANGSKVALAKADSDTSPKDF
ncbi:MAG: hypothetical protein ACI90U_001214 [Pseudomonadales bacterium]|jgi:hypothetical protein